MYQKMVERLIAEKITMAFIADQCGVSSTRVRHWRKGIGTPQKIAASQIRQMFLTLVEGGREAERLRARGKKKKCGAKGRPPTSTDFTPERVKKLLADNGWSNTDLGKIMGVSRTNVSAWRNGVSKPSGAASKMMRELESNPPSRADIKAMGYRRDIPTPARLRAVQKALGLTNDQIAAEIGVHVQNWLNWLNATTQPSGIPAQAIRKMEAQVAEISGDRQEK